MLVKQKKMEHIKSKQENPNGFHLRYNISKVDGTPIDENAEYFVLRLDNGGSDAKHIEACRKAILVYADEIAGHLPLLSNDLIKRYGKPNIDTGIFCPDCNTEMEQIDTTYSNMNTERATNGQHTGNVYRCETCECDWLENFLNGSKLERWCG